MRLVGSRHYVVTVGKYDRWNEFFGNLDDGEHRLDLDRFETEAGVQLPPSARAYAAWWSSARYYAIWADYGWKATPRLATNEVIFRRAPPRRSRQVAATPPAPTETDAELILVGCVSSKRPEASLAKDLYKSTLWDKRRRYAEATNRPWAILSAEYGLVQPDDVIEPYDRYLGSQARDYLEQWSRTTGDAVVRMCRNIGATSVEIHAGKAYIESGLEDRLHQMGIRVVRPLEHLRRGEQLAWYNARAGSNARVRSNARARGEAQPSAARTVPPVVEYDMPRTTDGPMREALSVLRTAASELGSIARRALSRKPKAVARTDAGANGAVVDALLRYGKELEAEGQQRRIPLLSTNKRANEFLVGDPFAFLVGVVSDYQIKAERAWELPYLLAGRLGHWGPEYVAAHLDGVVAAFGESPALHRFPTQTAGWVVEAANTVVTDYEGDAAAIWSGAPQAADLQRTLRGFDGISQKKAAMAVEILERDLGVPINGMHGSDIAYDVHIRRVFLRSGIAERDEVDHMVAAARRANPDRPGALDMPAWVIGREWCRPTDPSCEACAIGEVCPRLISRALGG